MTPSDEQNKVDFIHNPHFVEWVTKPTDELNQFWEAYLSENPSRKKELDHARFLLKGLLINEHSLTEAEVLALWDKIEKTKSSRNTKVIWLKRWSAAAGILLILGISGWLMSNLRSKTDTVINYKSIASNIVPGNEIKLILSDQSQKIFSSKDVELKYNQDGKLETKTGNQVQTEELRKSMETTQMNQLVVPRGKRSTIVLADGTKLWLNSGSRAIYPVAFNGKTREIYIEGEGYLEVAHDASMPFYVVSNQIKIKVLGTKFDISAYKEDKSISVVLVEGSVQATTATENLVMKPNQILNYEKLTQRSTIAKANVLEYVSWKDGWMLCNKEQIKSITTKLSRYYDVKISYNDLNLSNMTLTGKLDLKSNCEEVFKVICATAPLKYQVIGHEIFLTKK